MMKKRLMALVIACAMAIGTVPILSFASGEVTLDGLLGNELSNGTFEAGIDGWTAGEGITLSVDADNTHNNSAKAMKLEGSGSVSTSATLYKQETYDVSLWAKPVSGNVTVTVKVGDKTVIEQIVSAETKLNGNVNISAASYKGSALSSVSYDISVSVDGDCYIDDVIVTETENEVINAVSSAEMGAWVLRNTNNGTSTMSYNSVENAIEAKNTYDGDHGIVQYLALKKGSTYEISADIKLLDSSAANKMYYRIGPNKADNITITSSAVSKSEWKTVTGTYTNSAYPSGGEDGDLAGLYIAFFGWSTTSTADFVIKNVSVKEVKTETKYNAPSVSVTAEKADSVAPIVTPTVDEGDTAYYMYRYIANSTAVETGFGAAVPSYTVPNGFTGTLSLAVTPVNSQGTYGDTKTVSLTYEEQQIVNSGVDDLDGAIGNKILKGTFDNGMPTGWEFSGGVTLERDLDNTVDNSVASAKVSGIGESGTITISGTAMETIYAEQAYEMSLWVKPLDSSKPLNVSVKAEITGLTKDPLANATVTAGTDGWTKVSGKVSRFSGGNKNAEAKVLTANQVSFIISLSADCYIDEVMLKPADNYVTDENIKLNGTDPITEVNGWTLKGSATAEDAGTDGLKVSVSANQTNSLMQGMVLEKGSAYRMTADVKKQSGSANDKLKLYLGYTAASKTVTLTDEWQTVSFDLTSAVTSAFGSDKVGSSVYIGANGSSAAADLYIKNVTVTKIKNFDTAPEVTGAVLPSSVLSGENAAASAELSLESGDAAGVKYIYKLNGKALTAGYAAKETEIPSCTVPSSAEAGSKLTLTLIAVNTEGTYSAPVTSNECNVLKSFTVTAPEVSPSQIIAGSTLNLTVNVSNNTENTEKIAVIAAYFESEIMKACSLEENAVSSKGNTDFDVSINLPSNIAGNGEIRIFVWKGYDGQTFLMEPVSGIITPIK